MGMAVNLILELRTARRPGPRPPRAAARDPRAVTVKRKTETRRVPRRRGLFPQPRSLALFGVYATVWGYTAKRTAIKKTDSNARQALKSEPD